MSGNLWLFWFALGLVAWFPLRKTIFGGRYFYGAMAALLLPLSAVAQTVDNGPRFSLRYMIGSKLDGGSGSWAGVSSFTWVTSDTEIGSNGTMMGGTWEYSGNSPSSYLGVGLMRDFGEYWQGSMLQGRVGTTQSRVVTVRLFLGDDMPHAEVLVGGSSLGHMYGNSSQLLDVSYAQGGGSDEVSTVIGSTSSGPPRRTNNAVPESSASLRFSYFGTLAGGAATQPSSGATTRPLTVTTAPAATQSTWVAETKKQFLGDGEEEQGLLGKVVEEAGLLDDDQTERSVLGPRFGDFAFEACASPDHVSLAVATGLGALGSGINGAMGGNPHNPLGLESMAQLVQELMTGYGALMTQFAPLIDWLQIIGSIVCCWHTFMYGLEQLGWAIGWQGKGRELEPPIPIPMG